VGNDVNSIFLRTLRFAIHHRKIHLATQQPFDQRSRFVTLQSAFYPRRSFRLLQTAAAISRFPRGNSHIVQS
jgi:hypothetical protein